MNHRAHFLRAVGILVPFLAFASNPEAPQRTCLFGSGRSMLPTLPTVCRVVVVRVPFAEVRADAQDGDIIATRLNGLGVTHRAVARLPDGSLVTQGDNNGRADAGLTTGLNYVGVVVGFEQPGTVGELVAPAPRSVTE
ncbi:MAG TPA: S24/S26 family peptidase [Lacunisphaera sp.]|nr:S24/S26 family peptidase [Lacunisphaera sp.]